jgi:hypothetical protein
VTVFLGMREVPWGQVAAFLAVWRGREPRDFVFPGQWRRSGPQDFFFRPLESVKRGSKVQRVADQK